jgi:hypothetical protein
MVLRATAIAAQELGEQLWNHSQNLHNSSRTITPEEVRFSTQFVRKPLRNWIKTIDGILKAINDQLEWAVTIATGGTAE